MDGNELGYIEHLPVDLRYVLVWKNTADDIALKDQ